jgi:protoheme IX farnesyltransferase
MTGAVDALPSGVSVLNIGFLWYATRMVIAKTPPLAELLPMQTFSYSVIYLMVLFVFLLADHYLLYLVG